MFHVKHEGPGLGSAGVELDRSQTERLEAFERVLAARAVPLGLVAEADSGLLWERHVLDCLRAAAEVGTRDRDACDLGSGAGLPGIVMAIACSWMSVTLVEARQISGGFLELVVDTLKLGNARVVVGRAEELADRFDVCFARAFGDARASWAAAGPLLRPGGRLIYFAGEGFDPVPDSPSGVVTSLVAPPPIERMGPLAIMSRQ